jgi:uncharacterized protein YlxP (DUF503 family)
MPVENFEAALGLVAQGQASAFLAARRRRGPRCGMLARVWIGWIEFDVLLGDVHSLKEKRGVLRPVLAELRRATEASVAEVGAQDLHRRAGIGVGVVASDAERVTEVLDRAERLVAAHPEFTLLSARRRLRRSDDH